MVGDKKKRSHWGDHGPVLDGHQRHKKKLVPPLMRLPGGTRPLSTLDQIFPELFWMCLIFQENGPHRSTRVIIPILKALYEIDASRMWYRTSAMLVHFKHARGEIEKLGMGNEIEAVDCALRTLEGLYLRRATSCEREFEVGNQKALVARTVKNYWDKSESKYCSVLAACLVGLSAAGAMQLPPSLFENVNEIVDNFDSDAAQSTSSMMRAASNAVFPMDEDELAKAWCKNFWNTNGRLVRCEFKA